jgi:hypothetical protein
MIPEFKDSEMDSNFRQTKNTYVRSNNSPVFKMAESYSHIKN